MNKYLLIILISVFFASCSDELDIKSEASLSANMELSVSDIDKLLNGLYDEIDFPGDQGYWSVMYTEIMADNYKPVKFQWASIKEFYENKVPEASFGLSRYYRFGYRAIGRANTILKVPSATLHQLACARYGRALLYSRLYDMFESVPIVDENYDKKPIAPSPKADVLNFILEDLKFAVKNADAFDAENRVASQNLPSKEAAQALLARYYRLAGDKVNAAAMAELVISSGNFELSSNPTDRSKEVIFQFNNIKGQDQGSHGWIMSSAAKSWNCFAVADELYALIQGEDTRKSLYYDEDISGVTYHWTNKYTTDDASELVISRIAEMYLISAEVNPARLSEFQAVRKSALSLDNERRLELAFEWVRWQDLKLSGAKSYTPPYPTSAVDSNPLLK